MKNLNDLITMIVLILLVILSIRIFLNALFNDETNASFLKHLKLFKNYTDDESE